MDIQDSSMNDILTYYDSPERSTLAEIQKDNILIENNPIVKELIEGFPELVVILDHNRHIVAANNEALKSFRARSLQQVLGKRLGEALNCVHSDEMGAGCGTSKFCSECGAAQAIKYTNETGKTKEEECRITAEVEKKEVSLDIGVRTKKLRIGKKEYTLFAIKDKSNEKRRLALERIFFHDVLNTTGAVRGLVSVLANEPDESKRSQLSKSLLNISDQLIKEILAQKELKNAENGNLQVSLNTIYLNEVIDEIYYTYSNHNLSDGIKLSRAEESGNCEITTDPVLLKRALGNLVKNALEASNYGDTVLMRSMCDESTVAFFVHNQQVIPDSIQLNIFKRSFSTKGGTGRGLGTYSVKLLIEQYLNGEVGFESNNDHGTVFFIKIPVAPDFSVRKITTPKMELRISTTVEQGNSDTTSKQNDEIVFPDKDVLKNIFELAKLGDIRALNEIAKTLEESHPAFQSKISTFLGRFAVEEIAEMVKPHIE